MWRGVGAAGRVMWVGATPAGRGHRLWEPHRRLDRERKQSPGQVQMRGRLSSEPELLDAQLVHRETLGCTRFAAVSGRLQPLSAM